MLAGNWRTECAQAVRLCKCFSAQEKDIETPARRLDNQQDLFEKKSRPLFLNRHQPLSKEINNYIQILIQLCSKVNSNYLY